jgi:hypothetical protein
MINLYYETNKSIVRDTPQRMFGPMMTYSSKPAHDYFAVLRSQVADIIGDDILFNRPVFPDDYSDDMWENLTRGLLL